MPPPLSYVVYGFVYDIYGIILSNATVNLTHSTNTISGTTDANGEYNINLGNLPDVWAVGDSISIKGTKTAEGTKTVSTTILGGGSQRQDITLAETSDFVYDTQVQNRTNIVMAIPLHYDGLKVTRERPLPVLTQNPLEQYRSTDDDTAGNVQYYSFTDRFGNWFIEKYNVSEGSHRYAKGSSGYSTNWTSRATLSYDYFFNTF